MKAVRRQRDLPTASKSRPFQQGCGKYFRALAFSRWRMTLRERRGARQHNKRFGCASRVSGFILVSLFAVLALLLPAALPLPAQDVRAEGAFRELEEKLLKEPSLHFKFEITSQGSVDSSLHGQLRLKNGNKVEIQFSGTYQSRPVSVRFESDAKRMHWVAGDRKYELPTPKALNEGLVVGFTRMGLLHNLSALLAGKPPDHTDGSVEEWVQVSDFLFAAPDPSSKLRGRSIRFRISVDGKYVGDADYWISPLTRTPVERRQTVHLAEGDMKVVESYEFPD